MELKSTQHGYGQSAYHLVFVPKCRYKYFSYLGVKKLCEQSFREIAEKYSFAIIALEIQPDHVHLFVDFPPNFSVSKVVQLFKGISAFKILHKFPHCVIPKVFPKAVLFRFMFINPSLSSF